MTEAFIMTAFQRMGENPLSVKVMRSRMTGELCGYCFVHFESDDDAIKAMHKLNGKFIPNTSPVSFHLGLVLVNFLMNNVIEIIVVAPTVNTQTVSLAYGETGAKPLHQMFNHIV